LEIVPVISLRSGGPSTEAAVLISGLGLVASFTAVKVILVRNWALIHALVLCASLLVPLKSIADLAVPPGLQPGDTFQWVFVSTGLHDALSSDINDYNTFVQSQANLNVDLTGITFKAIGSTLTVDARDNALVSAPVYRLDGVNVATGFTDLWDGSLNAPISVNQFNQVITVANSAVHTGSDNAGVKHTHRYLGTTIGVSGGTLVVIGGDALSFAGNWIFTGQASSNGAKHYYGLSEVLTVSAVPEASAVTAWLLLSVVLAATYALRRCCF
jgi:hypothetical protein